MAYTPNHALELSIINYLQSQVTVSGSLLSGSNLTFYAGYDNEDLDTYPLCIVNVEDADESYYNTRDYNFNTTVFIKEQSYSGSVPLPQAELTVNAAAVLAQFVSDPQASQNFTNTGSYNIAIWQVRQTSPIKQQPSKDATVTYGDFIMTGGIAYPPAT